MVIFTSICANYFHKARTLAQSVKNNISDATFVVCLTERECSPDYYCPEFDSIVLARDIWDGDFNTFIFKHRIVEASTAVKGAFFKYLMRTYINEEKFVYLDPDVFVYSDFTELRCLLDKESIVVCPHLLDPGNIDMEISSLAHGVFNLGFLALRRTDNASRFLDWWIERLRDYCFDNIPRGIFTDQRWVDLAPCFFDVFIFKHKGYDFATWSLLNSHIHKIDNCFYLSNDPLRFIHYSGYGSTIETCMKNWLPPSETHFRKLYQDYQIVHEENNSDNVSTTPWSYGSYENGQIISDEVRLAYQLSHADKTITVNPFLLSDAQVLALISPENSSQSLLKKALRSLRSDGIVSTTKKILRYHRP